MSNETPVSSKVTLESDDLFELLCALNYTIAVSIGRSVGSVKKLSSYYTLAMVLMTTVDMLDEAPPYEDMVHNTKRIAAKELPDTTFSIEEIALLSELVWLNWDAVKAIPLRHIITWVEDFSQDVLNQITTLLDEPLE